MFTQHPFRRYTCSGVEYLFTFFRVTAYIIFHQPRNVSTFENLLDSLADESTYRPRDETLLYLRPFPFHIIATVAGGILTSKPVFLDTSAEPEFSESSLNPIRPREIWKIWRPAKFIASIGLRTHFPWTGAEYIASRCRFKDQLIPPEYSVELVKVCCFITETTRIPLRICL